MIRADGAPDPVSLGCPRPILAPYRIRATIPNDSIDVGKATGGDNERSGRGEKQRYDAQGRWRRTERARSSRAASRASVHVILPRVSYTSPSLSSTVPHTLIAGHGCRLRFRPISSLLSTASPTDTCSCADDCNWGQRATLLLRGCGQGGREDWGTSWPVCFCGAY